MPRYISAEQNQERRKLYDIGLSDREIAAKLVTHRATISYWRKVHGLAAHFPHRTLSNEKETERLGLYYSKLNDGQIARSLGLSIHTVLTWRRSRKLPANFARGRPKQEILERHLDSKVIDLMEKFGSQVPIDRLDALFSQRCD